MMWTGRAHCQRQVAFFFVNSNPVSSLFVAEKLAGIAKPVLFFEMILLLI